MKAIITEFYKYNRNGKKIIPGDFLDYFISIFFAYHLYIQTSTKSPNSTSSRHVHLSETISPSNHHNHHQHHHQSQSQTSASKQHLKKSGGSNSSGSNVARNSPVSSLLQMDGSVGIIGGMQHGTTITGGGNNDNPGSGLNNTQSRKSVVIAKEQQQQNANKKKQLNGKEIEELAAGLRKLNLTKETSLIEQFITSKNFTFFNFFILSLLFFF